MKNILIVEDDKAIAMALEDDFKYEGYDVMVAFDGKKGLELAMSQEVNLIILDVVLPEMNGYEVCKELRKRDKYIPIIMLTSKSQELDKILGLEFGADDYVTKPYSSGELKARVNALLRRSLRKDRRALKSIYCFENIKVDFDQYTATKDNAEINLTAHEFSLLKYFLTNSGIVLRRYEILNVVWSADVVVDLRTVDTHVSNLRKKLEVDPKNPKLLIGVRGVGYKFMLK